MADSGTRQGGSPVVPGAPTTKKLENPPVPIPPPRLVVSGFSIEKPSGFVGSESVWRQKGRAPMSGWPTSSAAVNFTEVNPEIKHRGLFRSKGVTLVSQHWKGSATLPARDPSLDTVARRSAAGGRDQRLEQRPKQAGLMSPLP